MSDQKQEIPEVPPFQEYKFEEDEGWQILQKKLEFPGNIDEQKKEKILLKKKKKYYKSIGGTIVDDSSSSLPSYTNPTEPDEVPSKNTTNNNNTKENDNSSKQQSNSSKSSSNNSNTSKSTSNNSNNSNKNKKKQHKRRVIQKPPLLQQFLNFFYLFSNWSCLLFGIASALIKSLYRYSLIICAIMHLICLIQTHGRPKFNIYFAQRLMQDSNTMILIYSLMFLMGPPIFIFLGPLLFRCFYMGCYLLKGVIDLYLYNNTLAKSYSLKLKKVIQQQGWFLTNIALFEVVIGVILIPCILFVKRTFLLTIIYWQIMQAKYMMDPNIKIAFSKVNKRILGYTSKIPMINGIYLKITAFLGDMVDPQKMRQRYEQQQTGGATGMAANMMKKCVIM